MAWALHRTEKEKPAAGKTDYWRDFWRSGWDSNPRNLAVQLISSQSRYDHFDTAPYLSQHQHLGKRGELMGRTSKNIKLRIPEKPHKIKGFRSGSYRVATTISSAFAAHAPIDRRSANKGTPRTARLCGESLLCKQMGVASKRRRQEPPPRGEAKLSETETASLCREAVSRRSQQGSQPLPKAPSKRARKPCFEAAGARRRAAAAGAVTCQLLAK